MFVSARMQFRWMFSKFFLNQTIKFILFIWCLMLGFGAYIDYKNIDDCTKKVDNIKAASIDELRSKAITSTVRDATPLTIEKVVITGLACVMLGVAFALGQLSAIKNVLSAPIMLPYIKPGTLSTSTDSDIRPVSVQTG